MTLQTELKSVGKAVSIRWLCSVLGMARSTLYYRPITRPKELPIGVQLQVDIYAIIQRYPCYGLRRIRVELYRRYGKWLNRKKIHRIIKRNQ